MQPNEVSIMCPVYRGNGRKIKDLSQVTMQKDAEFQPWCQSC